MASKLWTPGLLLNTGTSVASAIPQTNWNDPLTVLETPEQKMMKELVKNKVLSQAPAPVATEQQPTGPLKAPSQANYDQNLRSAVMQSQEPAKQTAPVEQPAGDFRIGELLARIGGLAGDTLRGDTQNTTQGAITSQIQSGLSVKEKRDMGDAKSEISNRYRDIASKLFPGQDFSKWAAADYEQFAPIVEKIYQEKSARQIVPGGGAGEGKSGQDVVGFEPIQGVNIDKTKIAKANEIASNLGKTMPILQNAISKMETLASEPLGGSVAQFDPKYSVDINSIKNQLTGLLRMSIVGPGTLSDSDKKQIESVINDPIPANALRKLKGVSERTIMGAQGEARGYGFKPAGNFGYLMYGEKPAEVKTVTSAPQTAKSPSIGQQVVSAGQKLAEQVAKVSPTAPTTQQFKEGDIREKNGIQYVRQKDGTWLPKR